MSVIAILGAGTWGSALANVLAKNNQIKLYSALYSDFIYLRDTRIIKNMNNIKIDDSILVTNDIKEAVDNADYIIFASPSIYIRETVIKAKDYIKDNQILINVAKGIDNDTLETMGEIITSYCPNNPFVVLSGPTHAEEVIINHPTTIVSASKDEKYALMVGELFKRTCIRVYTNSDVKGVELCGSLKNVIALAVGMVEGLGYGDNIRAALITRGMAEIRRIGLALGCDEHTFYGLAGIGDLIVTATSNHSRNNRCGKLIGEGVKPQEAIKQIGMVVEGINSLNAAVKLAKKYKTRATLIFTLNEIINKEKSPKEVIDDLLYRPVISEQKEAL